MLSVHDYASPATKNVKKRRKVLLIDYDPQFNLSQVFIPAKQYFALEAARKTSLAILQEDSSTLKPFTLQVPGSRTPPGVAELVHSVYSTGTRHLDIVASTLDLMYLVIGLPSAKIDPIDERFRKFIAECRTIYDVIIIDCHPSGSILTRTSLQNSDHVIIPVTPAKYAARGIELMMRFIAAAKQGSSGPVPHILFNATEQVLHATGEELAIRSSPQFQKNLAVYCTSTRLKWFKAFSDAADGQDFVWQSSKPHSTRAWTNLYSVVDELVQRLVL
jgi:chromosome partitioning protein